MILKKYILCNTLHATSFQEMNIVRTIFLIFFFHKIIEIYLCVWKKKKLECETLLLLFFNK